jgi:hypothetical protein
LQSDQLYYQWDGFGWQVFGGGGASNPNSIINGGFDIWQRGTSFTPTAAAWTYTADRWDTGRATGTSGATVTRESAFLQNQTYSLRYQRTNNSNSALYLVQRLESAMSIPLQGKTLVLSFYAKAGANFSGASNAINLHVYSGSGTDQGGFPSTWTGTFTLVNNQAFTLNTSWIRYEVSFNMPSLATQLGMLWTFNPTGNAGANDFYEIAGVQLEPGTNATAFRRNGNSLEGELSACQRYYWNLFYENADANRAIAQCNAASTVYARTEMQMAQHMRTAPTLITTPGSFLLGYSTQPNSNAVTAIDILTATRKNVLLGITLSGVTADRQYFLYRPGTTTGFAFQAEL